MEENNRWVNFLYEVGSLRRVPRAHQQTLVIHDPTDTIASHSFRVGLIGWVLAEQEGLDPGKVVQMCLLHDVPEIRTGDHHWVAKRYVKIFDEEIIEDQLGTLPSPSMHTIMKEYEKRESPEAIVAKDADMLDQILLLREYEWQGNKEATVWLNGRDDEFDLERKLSKLKTESAKALGAKMYEMNPGEWFKDLVTDKNR